MGVVTGYGWLLEDLLIDHFKPIYDATRSPLKKTFSCEINDNLILKIISNPFAQRSRVIRRSCSGLNWLSLILMCRLGATTSPVRNTDTQHTQSRYDFSKYARVLQKNAKES